MIGRNVSKNAVFTNKYSVDQHEKKGESLYYKRCMMTQPLK